MELIEGSIALQPKAEDIDPTKSSTPLLGQIQQGLEQSQLSSLGLGTALMVAGACEPVAHPSTLPPRRPINVCLWRRAEAKDTKRFTCAPKSAAQVSTTLSSPALEWDDHSNSLSYREPAGALELQQTPAPLIKLPEPRSRSPSSSMLALPEPRGASGARSPHFTRETPRDEVRMVLTQIDPEAGSDDRDSDWKERPGELRRCNRQICTRVTYRILTLVAWVVGAVLVGAYMLGYFEEDSACVEPEGRKFSSCP